MAIITRTYKDEETGLEVQVHFDDMRVQHLESIDHSRVYECRGYDVNGGEYSGIATYTCDELDSIENIEKIN